MAVSWASTSETIRFTKWEDIASPTADQTAYRKAVKFLDSDTGTCTATAITGDGVMLTARHCLTKCMFRSGIYKDVPVDGGATVYYDFDKSKAMTSDCAVKIDQQDVKIQVLASSPGFIMALNEKSVATLEPALYKQLVAEGYTNLGDFAIFKIKNVQEKTACVSLSSRPVQAGDSQQTLGYPSETNRPDGFNSDGKSLYYSKGFVEPSIFDIPCVQNLTLTDYQKGELNDEYANALGFMTTVDAIYGSSGSSVLGPDGKIAGILTNIFRLADYTKLDSDEPEVKFCEGSTRALSVEAIRESLTKQGYDVDAWKCDQ